MTFRDTMEKAGVDMDETLRRFGGNSTLMERFMRRFPDDPTFAELQKARTEWDAGSATGLDDILRAAHTLKGTSGNLGLAQIYAFSSEILETCRAGHSDKLPSILDALFQEYVKVVALLGQLDEA